MTTVGPFNIIAGKSNIPKKQDVLVNNLAELAPAIQKGIKVDYYIGSSRTETRRSLRDQISEYIVPSTNTRPPILPNFFVAAKGPDGNAPVVKRQALHNGVIGARGIHKFHEHINIEELADEKVYTITSTYSGGPDRGILTLYTVHPTASKEVAREQDYYMTKLGAIALDRDPDTFRQRATAFRNSRDWAREQRQQLIRAGNTAFVRVGIKCHGPYGY